MANTELFFDNLDEQAMLALAAKFAQNLPPKLVLYLTGDLGAGKTTFSRGLIQALGHQGAVKSPTYTLVEPYAELMPPVYHFDLYRLSEPEELEYIGIRDYAQENALFIFEWPQKGRGFLPAADIQLDIRSTSAGKRALLFTALQPDGQALLAGIA